MAAGGFERVGVRGGCGAPGMRRVIVISGYPIVALAKIFRRGKWCILLRKRWVGASFESLFGGGHRRFCSSG